MQSSKLQRLELLRREERRLGRVGCSSERMGLAKSHCIETVWTSPTVLTIQLLVRIATSSGQ